MIDKFCGKYLFLSNFEICEIIYDGHRYLSVEAAYQAQKVKSTKIQEDRIKEIFTNLNPIDAKALGNVVQLRPDWEEVRLNIMKELLDIKFSKPEYQERLLATGDEELVELNYWHDTFYGACTCDEHQGMGENHLGNYLMEIRERIRNERNNN